MMYMEVKVKFNLKAILFLMMLIGIVILDISFLVFIFNKAWYVGLGWLLVSIGLLNLGIEDVLQ